MTLQQTHQESVSSSSSPSNPSNDSSVVRLPNTQAHMIWQNRLFLGSASCANNKMKLLQDGVTHVVNVARDLPTQDFDSHITVRHWKLHDAPSQWLPLDAVADYIWKVLNDNNKDNKVLVHCYAGQSRSASLVIYFLMKYGGGSNDNTDADTADSNTDNDNSHKRRMTLQQAFQITKQRKPDIRPNFGFASQLEKAEQKLFADNNNTQQPHQSFDLTEYKIDSIWEILEGAPDITRDVIRQALKDHHGDGEAALESLLR